jgi:hypothetical protein
MLADDESAQAVTSKKPAIGSRVLLYGASMGSLRGTAGVGEQSGAGRQCGCCASSDVAKRSQRHRTVHRLAAYPVGTGSAATEMRKIRCK